MKLSKKLSFSADLKLAIEEVIRMEALAFCAPGHPDLVGRHTPGRKETLYKWTSPEYLGRGTVQAGKSPACRGQDCIIQGGTNQDRQIRSAIPDSPDTPGTKGK